MSAPLSLLRKAAPWLSVFALAYIALGTAALFYWSKPLTIWMGYGELLSADAIPIPVRMLWAVAVFFPAGILFNLGRWLALRAGPLAFYRP
ncbi:hypothetical protein [Methylibium petroleiphilum]|uniref:Transmembrane protein n=1 Tax=Methylibium petroleiphilum (strain ATCC BAA-1232 / LMG 22953 / PM1) TaxID=420662 RepID=A2SMY3_METPP|nr:hypothetical protein [Methylibium petroleiphilum]ABM96922.1 hypothetical protein Mpe_B0144 [Methylibium petroleiphilum PM1]